MRKEEINLKKTIWRLLEKHGLEGLEEALNPYPPSKRISYLISAFLHPNEEVRWKAIYAFGKSVALLAEEDLEKAKIIIRRLMWMLNEESGGMAWGVGEAFAEALYHSLPLKIHYLQIFLSYIWPEGNYLEFPPAQRGVLWGIGRLSQKYKEDLAKMSAPSYLVYHLSSPDLLVIFFSLWSLSFFRDVLAENKNIIQKSFSSLENLKTKVLLFDGKEIKPYSQEDLKELYSQTYW